MGERDLSGRVFSRIPFTIPLRYPTPRVPTALRPLSLKRQQLLEHLVGGLDGL